MIYAEKVFAKGRLWIKVQFKNNAVLFNEMSKVKGAKYNPATNLWSVPYEYREDFENKMGDYLILWTNDDRAAGGIPEEKIPDQPVVPGYSVVYDENKNIISSTGFKTPPWGEFQVKGFNVLVTRPFLILADDAGLGKSWQVSTAMEARKKMGQVERGVVICKASLLFNWRDEIHKHTYCKAVVVAGTQRQRAKIYEELKMSNDWTFMVISYETFRCDVNNILYLHNYYKPLDFCIVDEGHKIKNPQSRIGDVIHYIPFKYKYVLTATPLPNTPLESYNYLKLGGKVNINWLDFRNRYAVWGGRQNKEILMYQRISELRRVIQKNMLRRLKKDKLKELPEIVFKTIPLGMSAKQRKLYDAVKKEILEDLKDTSLKKVPSALAKLLRLQQITNSPALIGADEVESSKLQALDELLEKIIDESNQKVIVFSRFRTMTEILKERYKKYNPAVIHGDVDANGKTENAAVKAAIREIGKEAWLALPEEEKRKLTEKYMSSDRQKEVYKFQQDDTCKLFIGCAPACREGLTLTAATHVVFLDCEWSPAYVEQAYSRAHRIGQKNAVTVYYLVCEGTIDEFVQRVLQRKEAMAQTMLDEGIDETVGRERARELIAEMIGEEVPRVT